MVGKRTTTPLTPSLPWRMPIVPDSYDRHSLTEEEYTTLQHYLSLSHRQSSSQKARSLRSILARLDQPIVDVHYQRHQGMRRGHSSALTVMRKEMYLRQKVFWDWSLEEWLEILCPTTTLFWARHQRESYVRTTIIDVAYFLGQVSDLRAVQLRTQLKLAAKTYFNADLLDQQCQRVVDVLSTKGYSDGPIIQRSLHHCLYTLFILNRSPYLEDITPETFISVSQESDEMRQMCRKIAKCLPHLQGCLPEPANRVPGIDYQYKSSDMAQEWYNWCMAWYHHAVDLAPRERQSYTMRLLAVGRWLHQYAPTIREPEHWTEDLALRFRSDVCSWTIGQYASETGKRIHQQKGVLGHPMKAASIDGYLTTLRRFLTDLTKWPLAVGGTPAHKIKIDFAPKEVLTTPKSVRRALDAAEPRDIDLHIWARLVIAAATLSQGDLPFPSWYPLSLYRALGLLWVTSARRPNELVRLRLDCIREEWSPEMRDEEGLSLEKITLSETHQKRAPNEAERPEVKLFYLHIPTGKSRGAFWIWIPDYVVQSIEIWKSERPPHQRKIVDQKDQEYVDYLFCYRDAQIGDEFLNRTLIPTLCKKAGIDIHDAKGKISGHRGRSTRLTLLRRNGVSLDDLAEYAGHTDTKTIRRYARHHPLQLHRIIRDADDLSRILEGVVDLQAAAQGLPALRWFLGYNADGEPQYCANQVYHTCPHRLDCERCGMFIGGEKARLLHEGDQTLPITSKVPMTPIEQCVVSGDQEGETACRAALQQIPAPETSDIRLMFNPEGLSYDELKKLALLGTPEALNKLHQALSAHEKRLEEMKQHKTGRNALVGAQKKRIKFIQDLLATVSQDQRESERKS